MKEDHLANIKAHHLNDQQKKAVLTTKGKVLILAGAGSGKTSTLSYRIAHLIENEKVDPSSILGLTFTNKAAQEMRARVSRIICKKKTKEITLSTFHSFCMQVLRDHIQKLGYTKSFTLYDDHDMKRLTTQLSRTLLEHDKNLPSLETTIALLKEKQNHPTSEISSFQSNWQKEFVEQLHQDLEMSLRAYNAVDFDRLISLTVKLFQENPDVLDLYQTRYQYIMIDEYQDTNPLQYELAKALSQKHHNLCVVGDDDQSIYGWRGAEVRHILKFDYNTLIKLEQNYRSSKNILAAANAVIKNNTERHPKTLWSLQNKEYPVEIFHAPSEPEEAAAVVARILDLKNSGSYQWKDFAILYRSNQLSRAFEVALMQAHIKTPEGWKRGIPYEVFGGLELYQRSEVKDLLSYLRVIANPKDQEALLRIINYPRRGIAEKTLDLLTSANRRLGISLWELLHHVCNDSNDLQEVIASMTPKAFSSLSSFVHLIEEAIARFETPPLADSLRWLVDTINYKDAIELEVKSEKMQSFKWENVEECIQMLKSYDEDPNSAHTLEEFLSTTLLDERKFSHAKSIQDDAVHLMTFHSAKGLEFPVCFLVALEDHLIPHEKSLMETGIEEERRLMYVALTRCKERLYLSMSRQRKRHGKEVKSTPSRFLFEIPQELLTPIPWKT